METKSKKPFLLLDTKGIQRECSERRGGFYWEIIGKSQKLQTVLNIN